MAVFFLDCEASSLNERASYPIEIAWGDVTTGIVESHLIDPTGIAAWRDWDPSAQAVHGLDQGYLHALGEPPRQVAERIQRCLVGQTVYITAHMDQIWVDRLTMQALGMRLSIYWWFARSHFLETIGGDDDTIDTAMQMAWDRLERQGIHPHRAGNDVWHLLETRRLLLAG